MTTRLAALCRRLLRHRDRKGPSAPGWDAAPRPGAAVYDVVFATRRGYQVREIGFVARALRDRGLTCACLTGEDAPGDRAATAASGAGLDLVPWARYVAGAARPRVLAVRSEVYGEIRALLEHARRVGVQTAAIAHPVINFTRHPVPYPASAHVLCAGPYTARRLGRGGVVVTGFPGFDELARVERRPVRPAQVLVNLSLPRGLEKRGVDVGAARDRWMEDVAGACDATGLPYVVSRHPADTAPVRHGRIDGRPVYDLLAEASAVVSPPSTVLLEALRMGIPGVCHRAPALAPYEMDTFDEPHGAFRNTTERGALADALAEILPSGVPVRAAADAFVAEHVSIDPARAGTERVADALAALVRDGRPGGA